MTVADSTFIAEGILADRSFIRNELMLAPDMAVHEVAVRHRIHPLDAMFIAVALRHGLELATLDEAQRKVFEKAKSAGRPEAGVKR